MGYVDECRQLLHSLPAVWLAGTRIETESAEVPIAGGPTERFRIFRVRLESDHLHGIGDFVVAHKVIPAETGAKIFRH